MKNYRYMHYVASIFDRRVSGTVDAAPSVTPDVIHDEIQKLVCKNLGLGQNVSTMVVVEVMNPIE